VYQSDTTCFAIAFSDALDDAVAWCEERHPVARDEQVGLHTANLIANFPPIERVAGMDLLRDM
jgi:hypothetical protein